jgi:RNA polymerase sigma-70 factor (ECF subfamily)
MAEKDDGWSVDDVLSQAAWMRQLARRLVRDAADRDDVVQEAWIQALRHSPRAESLRPWLVGVLRNVTRMGHRADARRHAREIEADEAAGQATPEQMIERVEIEREVAAALLEVAEPYRSTLLWRYYEDLSAAEIARRSGVPAGTVRWRIKHGLELLRANLDARFGGDRRRWSLALVPSAVAARGGTAKVVLAAVGGLLIMKATTKVAAAVLLLALFIAGGIALFRPGSSSTEVAHARPGTAWRVPGGLGATAAAPPTVAGVALPSWFGQRGASVRRIAGRVTFAGQPVAGATVELGSDLTDAGVIAPARRRTGSDGTFDFGPQPPAKFSVAATAEGRSPAIVETDTRNPTTASEHLELRLGGCDSQLLGHVSDASGGPIASAEVCLAPPRASACVTTDGGGAYSLCLTPRQNTVTVAARGYGAIYDRFEYTGRRVQRDYALTPEATIVGRVVRADNSAPVAGASVRASSTERGLRTGAPGATTTSDDGRFTIAGLAGGRYRVGAFAEGLAAPESIEINVEPGRPSGEVVLRLLPASRLSGTVTDGREPIVGATVSLGFGQPDAVDAVTQSDGSFIIDPVARGVASVAVRPYEVNEPKTIRIDRPTVAGVRILVDTMGSIAGRVTKQGKAVPGARTYVSMALEPVYADDNGNYIVHGLPPGHYKPAGEDPYTREFGFGTDFMLARGEHRTGADFEIQYNGMICGSVVEPDGKPVSGASVMFQALHINDVGKDVTSVDGSYCAKNLLGGDDYGIEVDAAAQTTVRLKLAPESPTTVHVADGQSVVQGVRLVVQRDHLSITGTTVDGDKQPISDVRVVAFRSDDMTGAMLDDWFTHASAISGGDGSFTIGDLDAATYVLRARAGDGSEGILRGVQSGQKNVVISMQRAGAIEGTLVGFSSPPAVRAIRQLGMSLTSVYATVDGTSFHFAGLSPGTYQVTAMGSETDGKSVTVTAGQTATVTLQSRSTTTIRGRAVDWASGAGVSGMRCSPAMRVSTGMPVPVNTIVAFSDDSGAFVLEGVPVGDVSVWCMPSTQYWSNGRADLTVAGGQDASCEVQVVKVNPDLPPQPFGGAIEPGSLPARFSVVDAGGPAARAGIRSGDAIVSIDGASVTRLTPMGIYFLIFAHPIGGTVHLGLDRGAQNVMADLTLPTPGGR